MGKSAGPAPDYKGFAEQQQASSQQNVQRQLEANRPNINTPFAQQSWSRGLDGEWTLNSGLNGGLGQAAFALGNQAGATLSQPLDPSLFGPVQTGDAAREQAISGAYNQAQARLDPMFARREEALGAKLAAQGLNPNSQAYRSAMGQFGTERNDAYNAALSSAIGQGTQAGAATFQQNLAAQQQGLANALRARNQPLADLQALQGFTTQMPGFNQAGMAEATQYLPAAMAFGNYNLQDAASQNQMWGSLLGGIGNLAGGIGGFWGK